VTIDWGALPVADVYPQLIPDVFSAKPIVIHGRLTGPPEGIITVRGNTGAGPYAQAVEVSAPADATDHEALASLWARAKVEDLMARDYAAAQSGQFPDELKRQVTALGLEFRLMTQFTSFVAVEELTVTAGGEPVQVTVPVEMPQGVSYEGVFGVARAGGGMHALSSFGFQMRSEELRGAIVGAGGRSGAGAPSAAPPVTTVAAGKPAAAEKSALGKSDGDGLPQDAVQSQPAPDPAAKLAAPLADLAAKVAKEGQDGNYALGKLKVTRYRVDVLVYLADLSEPTLAALKELGFEQTGESKSIRLLIGSLDVRKLLDLARLPAVIRVKPVVEPGP
jgi:Ca-activated chloride channel family protein